MPLIGPTVAMLVALTPLFALAGQDSACDGAQEISFAEAQTRALAAPSPVTPPLAKATGIGGIVKIAVCVSDKGEVTSTKMISGHPLLVVAAVSNVKAWRFSSGQAPFRTVMEIAFTSAGTPAEQAEADALSRAYFAAERQCRQDLQGNEIEAGVRDCRESLELAEKLPPYRSNERTIANELMGHAFFREKDFHNALKYYSEELTFARQTLHGYEAELAYAYRDVARANHVLGNSAEAAEAYEKAEEILPLAVQNIGHFDGLDKKYLATLKQVQQEHLILLQQIGDTAGAAALREKIESGQN